jgi:hypothetical protein
MKAGRASHLAEAERFLESHGLRGAHVHRVYGPGDQEAAEDADGIRRETYVFVREGQPWTAVVLELGRLKVWAGWGGCAPV